MLESGVSIRKRGQDIRKPWVIANIFEVGIVLQPFAIQVTDFDLAVFKVV